MPASSFVDLSSRLVITLCAGEVTLAEVTATVAEIRDHPGFHPDFRQLVDLSQVSNLRLHFNDLHHLHHACDPFSNQGKRAVVACDNVTFGMSRMYQLITNSPQFEVFRSLPEAVRWLKWDATLLEGVVHDDASKESLAFSSGGATYSIGGALPANLVEFLKRLRKGTSG